MQRGFCDAQPDYIMLCILLYGKSTFIVNLASLNNYNYTYIFNDSINFTVHVYPYKEYIVIRYTWDLQTVMYRLCKWTSTHNLFESETKLDQEQDKFPHASWHRLGDNMDAHKRIIRSFSSKFQAWQFYQCHTALQCRIILRSPIKIDTTPIHVQESME